MDTRKKILERALELFNESGVHAVGVRDIARALEISPGNLQYHFATKDLLVAELIRQLHAANNDRVAALDPATMDMREVFELTRRSLRGQIAYRGVLLSYAEIVASSKPLQKLAHEMDQVRPERMRIAVSMLVENDMIDPARIRGQEQYLRLHLEALGRFWLPAAILDGRRRALKKAADDRSRLMLHAWRPYATKAGRTQIDEILEETIR